MLKSTYDIEKRIIDLELLVLQTVLNKKKNKSYY